VEQWQACKNNNWNEHKKAGSRVPENKTADKIKKSINRSLDKSPLPFQLHCASTWQKHNTPKAAEKILEYFQAALNRLALLGSVSAAANCSSRIVSMKK
jgi:hypothetical protein